MIITLVNDKYSLDDSHKFRFFDDADFDLIIFRKKQIQ